MPLFDPDVEVCPGDTVVLGNNVSGTFTSIEWTVLDYPPASQPLLGNPTSALTGVQFPGLGVYRFKRCVFFDAGGSAEQQGGLVIFDPSLGCPLGAIEGQNVYVALNNAENSVVTYTITGDATGTPDGNDGITINTNGPGPVTIDVVAVWTSLTDGSTQTETDSCTFEVYPIDTEFVTRTSEVLSVEVEDCGEFCVCEEVTITVVECDPGQDCVVLYHSFVTKDCAECIKEEIVPATLAQPPIGVMAMTDFDCPDEDQLDWGCNDEPLCCLEHRPAIIWKEACALGWEYTAVGAIEPGYDISGLCPCNPGERFCWRGPLTIFGSGPNTLIDTMILSGHNLADSTVATSPYAAFGGGPVSVGQYQSNSGVPPTSEPVVVYFDQVNNSTGNFSITITPADPNKLCCIENLFLAAKLFLPEDSIPAPWTNPNAGMKRKIILKKNKCGVVGVSTELAEKKMIIPIKCMTEPWTKKTFRALMEYLDYGAPIGFAWSIEQCPEDIFIGRVEGCFEGPNYAGGPYQTATLELVGYVGQNQSLDYL